MSNPYTGFHLDQPGNVQQANRMDPEDDSTMLLLPPTVAEEVMEALSWLADAVKGLIDLRTEEPDERKLTPPALPSEQSPAEKMRKTLAQFTGGKGKDSGKGKKKGTRKRPTEKITEPGHAQKKKESAPATVTSGSKYPVGTAPLAKPEDDPIIDGSGDDDDGRASTPESAARDTDLSQVLRTLTVKTPEEVAAVVTQISASLAAPPVMTGATLPIW